jgi:hypothetical protein
MTVHARTVSGIIRHKLYRVNVQCASFICVLTDAMKPLFRTAIIGTPAAQQRSDKGSVSVGLAPMQMTREYGASGSDELSKKVVTDLGEISVNGPLISEACRYPLLA